MGASRPLRGLRGASGASLLPGVVGAARQLCPLPIWMSLDQKSRGCCPSGTCTLSSEGTPWLSQGRICRVAPATVAQRHQLGDPACTLVPVSYFTCASPGHCGVEVASREPRVRMPFLLSHGASLSVTSLVFRAWVPNDEPAASSAPLCRVSSVHSSESSKPALAQLSGEQVGVWVQEQTHLQQVRN